MKTRVQWLGAIGLLLSFVVALSACGTTPVVEGQSQTSTDVRPNEETELDTGLLKQVDAALAAAKGRGEDVSSPQALRDSVDTLVAKSLFGEANGNLSAAALQLGVLAGPGGEDNRVVIRAIPNAPAQAAPRSGTTVLANTSFSNDTSLTNWEQVGPSIPTGKPLWEVSNGNLAQRGVDGIDATNDATGLVTGDAAWTDVTVSVDALGRDTREVGLIARQNGESYYRFRALLVGTGSNSGNYLLERVDNGVATRIGSFDGAELSADAWHHLSMTVSGSTISVSVDGTQLGSVEDSTLTAGKAGVNTLAMSGAYFANFQVTGR